MIDKMTTSFPFLILLVGLNCLSTLASPQCHSQSDTGNYECLNIEGYDHSQYATCLTNQYVMQKTNYRYFCAHNVNGEVGEVPICWYQCMVKLHDSDSGPVVGDCRCVADEQVTKQPPKSSFSRACHTPAGTDCRSYYDCLKAKYTCFNKGWTEMIKLGTLFCNLSSQLMQTDSDPGGLSQNGKLWLQEAKACFQVHIAPVFKKWIHVSCSELNEKSVTVIDKCLEFPSDVIKVCDVASRDLWNIFWTTTETFATPINIRSLTKFSNLIQSCRNGGETVEVRKIKINFKKTIDAIYFPFEEYIMKIAQSQNWKFHNIKWYAYFDQGLTILLTKESKDAAASLETVIKKFANDFQGGVFQFYIEDKLVKPESGMCVCRDLDCTETYMQRHATYPEITSTKSPGTLIDNVPHQLVNDDLHQSSWRLDDFDMIAIGFSCLAFATLMVFICYKLWKRTRDEDSSNLVSGDIFIAEEAMEQQFNNEYYNEQYIQH